ncbi:pantoate--beta-alanine ligase [Thermoflavimicrobium dichotomicum]|uniref:Pantothenate synthetase n=1 Tax=Thermoflavimicrobium dichotomicum TaxID=46223 RepID=A0A1I3SKW9_9BACL|nr:pantoate--beta-alanine ligase [Thermoflavimicrobium dichotomicum]SFJ59283.1 pantoate--beta-alanine ligase [Thermoflavimicrobium dichotomicum]
MKIIETIEALRQELKPYRNQTIGFVPTMGYLHEGHLSLVRRASQECDIVVMSIFVNPLQFGPNEDLDRYPRDLPRDAALAEQAGVDFLFHPSVEEMYPNPTLTQIVVSKVTEPLCGASRPGHFTGVATVVGKLFHIVMPDRAYFGLKDAQQVAVIQQMVEDLNFPVTIVPCDIVREPDGLAMSSRNVYLSPEERKQAVILSQALFAAKKGLEEGEWSTADEVNRFVREMILTQPLAEIDYVETLAYPSLQPVDELKGQKVIVAVAVRFGKTRLIDNILHAGEE